MNVFERSWKMTKLSLNVMKKDKELFLFPIIGGIFSLIFLLSMIFPVLVTSAASDASGTSSGMSFYLLIFLIYFGLAMIATFFNTCVVYTVKRRFDGGNATFWESIKFTLSRIHLVIAWGIISATVGLLLRILDQIGENMGEVGQIMMSILTSILGAIWSIITVFVIPAMVYHNIGPFKAIKMSIHSLKKTWGESLVRYYGLGLIEAIMIVVGVILGIIFAIVTSPVPALFYTVIIIFAIYLVAVLTFFSVANTIFNTALFVYADTGRVPKAYDAEIIEHAFAKKEKKR
jgi:hypothetical protein